MFVQQFSLVLLGLSNSMYAAHYCSSLSYREWESIREYLEVATVHIKRLGLKDIITKELQLNDSALLNRLRKKWKGYVVADRKNVESKKIFFCSYTLDKAVNRVYRKRIVRSIGLDRCRLLLSGFAPISQITLAYLKLLNLIVCEVYGMAETTGKSTILAYSGARYLFFQDHSLFLTRIMFIWRVANLIGALI